MRSIRSQTLLGMVAYRSLWETEPLRRFNLGAQLSASVKWMEWRVFILNSAIIGTPTRSPMVLQPPSETGMQREKAYFLPRKPSSGIGFPDAKRSEGTIDICSYDVELPPSTAILNFDSSNSIRGERTYFLLRFLRAVTSADSPSLMAPPGIPHVPLDPPTWIAAGAERSAPHLSGHSGIKGRRPHAPPSGHDPFHKLSSGPQPPFRWNSFSGLCARCLSSRACFFFRANSSRASWIWFC